MKFGYTPGDGLGKNQDGHPIPVACMIKINCVGSVNGVGHTGSAVYHHNYYRNPKKISRIDFVRPSIHDDEYKKCKELTAALLSMSLVDDTSSSIGIIGIAPAS